MYRSEVIKVKNSPMQTLLFEPKGTGPHPGLILAQHLPIAHAGLEKDPFVLELGQRYAAAGYVCAIPFLFHWWPENEDITVKREAFRDDWTVADLQAAYNLLAKIDTVAPDKIGILGHCWGGRVAWLGACNNSALKACVMYYGGRIKVAFADNGTPPIQLAEQITCPVLGIFGNEDQGPSPADVDDYEAALKNAGRPYEFHRYDGAGHGFQNSFNPERYCEDQSNDAWAKTLAFLNKHLKSSR